MMDWRCDLGPLFNFSSLAFVGASDSSHFGLGAFRAMRGIGFQGDYYPINPRREIVHGVRAFKTPGDVPGPIAAAVISVGRNDVLEAFEGCADKGARAIVVLSGNFAEADDEGKQLQERLRLSASERRVILIGPNCMGAASLTNHCALYQGPGLDVARRGNIGLVSQSGGLMHELLRYGTARGLGFSNIVSTGNEAGTTQAHVIDYYVRDAATEVIVAVVETVREPELFVSALEAAARAGKPVIVLKLGVSEKGARSALTHTGALAGDDAVWEGLLRQKAAIRVRDLDEAIDAAAMLSPAIPMLGKRSLERAAVIEISGGGKELVCDVAEAAGLDLPDLTEQTLSALAPVLPDYIHIGNPIDAGVLWAGPAMEKIYPVALEALARQDDIDIVVSRYIVPSEGEMGGLRDRVTELQAARAAHPDRLFAIVSPTSIGHIAEWTAAVAEFDIPFVPGFDRGFRALGHVAEYSRMLRRFKAAAPRELRPSTMVTASARAWGDFDQRVLNEVESKDVLRAAGLPVIATHLARTEEDARTIAADLRFPLVAKVVSPQMTHKSDAGGVRLNIANITELLRAFADFKQLVAATDAARFDGVAIQAMAPAGLEIVLGAHHDPQFGPVLMFGLGGIFVETLGDVTLRVAPVTPAEAAGMLDDIRAARLLDGARGGAPVDRQALVRALVSLSDIMLARPDIASIDVNPAFAYADRLLVVDARIALREPALVETHS